MLRQRLLRHCRWCCYSRYVNAAVVATGMTYFRWHSGRGPRTTRPSHRLTRTSTSTTSSRRATWPNICTNWTRTTISTTSISDGKEQVRLWIPPTDIHLPVERTWHMGASFQCPVAHCKPVDNFYTLWRGFTERFRSHPVPDTMLSHPIQFNLRANATAESLHHALLHFRRIHQHQVFLPPLRHGACGAGLSHVVHRHQRLVARQQRVHETSERDDMGDVEKRTQANMTYSDREIQCRNL